jgi:hypothetical protein
MGLVGKKIPKESQTLIFGSSLHAVVISPSIKPLSLRFKGYCWDLAIYWATFLLT